MIKAIPKIAFFDFTSCEGCQLTVLDALQLHPELLDFVQIVQFREASSEMETDYRIAFVEGAISLKEQVARLESIRKQAEFVIALGACAHLGGVNSIRNWQPQKQVRNYVYGDTGKRFGNMPVLPIDAVITVDGYLPGCPIDRLEFVRVIQALLQDRIYSPPDYPVCVECRLKENICVLWIGKACLGPVTIAGCTALCPSFGSGCAGCRGNISNCNLTGLKHAFNENGIGATELSEMMKLFQSHSLQQTLEGNDG